MFKEWNEMEIGAPIFFCAPLDFHAPCFGVTKREFWKISFCIELIRLYWYPVYIVICNILG